MKKVGIIVVTYNRLDCLKKNIDHIFALTPKKGYEYLYFYIDNCSSDGTQEYLSNIQKRKIIYYRSKSNCGGAGGFSIGMQIACKMGVDYIFGMDDDAYVEKNCLYNLLSQYERLDKESCLFANSNLDHQSFNDGYKEISSFMFVGFFISTSIIKQIGYPRDDFFIYHDDAEYSYRITHKAKKHIYKVENAVIEHRIAGAPLLIRLYKRKEVSIYEMPDWKLYYFVRNAILKYKKSDLRYYKTIANTLRYVNRVKIVNPKQYIIAKKGFIDGLRGKSGKTVSP